MKILFTTIALTFLSAGFAQQDELYTQFWNTYSNVNPAVSGVFYKHQASALYRNQWQRVSGSPTTITGNYNARLDALHGGLGVTYKYETIGFSKEQSANLNYSFHLKLGENAVLAAGVSAGIVNMKREAMTFTTGATPPSQIFMPEAQGSAFNMNAGLVFKTKKLSVGVSSSQLNQPRIQDLNYSASPSYHMFADYTFNFGDNFYLKPQMAFTANQGFYTLDINALAYYKSAYWLGASLRNRDGFAFMAGWDIKEKFRIGYSYDVTVSKLNNGISNGSHEIVLGFMLK